MNAFNERFNRTVQEDFVDYEEDLLAEDLRSFNHRLLDYLDRYNGQRPHRGIDNRTPCQMLAQYLPDLSHMWWPHTTHILGTLDDKIELNRRMNETLEEIARALFKSWFADFDPVRAKMEGLHPYFDPDIWDLFPDALDDMGKPVGWKESSVGEIAESSRKSTSPADVAEDTPYICLEHMPRRSIALTEWEDASKVTSNKSVFKKGKFLFGKLRPYFYKIGFAPVDGVCSTDIVVVTPREPHWASFTLARLSSDEFVDYTSQTSTGTKMPRTNWNTIGQYKITLPSEQVARVFQRLTQPLFERVSTNIQASHTLVQTRDLLLPKLISGEIRIRDAKKAVDAVAS